jgi:hypothetical protein
MNGSEPSTDLIGLVKPMQVEMRPKVNRKRRERQWDSIIYLQHARLARAKGPGVFKGGSIASSL